VAVWLIAAVDEKYRIRYLCVLTTTAYFLTIETMSGQESQGFAVQASEYRSRKQEKYRRDKLRKIKFRNIKIHNEKITKSSILLVPRPKKPRSVEVDEVYHTGVYMEGWQRKILLGLCCFAVRWAKKINVYSKPSICVFKEW
jgi:hypothetical protein